MNNSRADYRFKKLYDAISQVNKIAYRDVFLMSNEVLSKNTFTSKLLHRYIKGGRPRPHRLYVVLFKLMKYYYSSLKEFFIYILRFVEYFMASYRYDIGRADKRELVLIDTFFLIGRINKMKSFKEVYLPGVEEVIEKSGHQFAYLPCFYDYRGALSLYRALRVLKRGNVPALTEFQLLDLADIGQLIYFIAVYPFRVLALAARLDEKADEEKFIKHELIDTLDQVVFASFGRYLLGRRVSQMPFGKIKVISWYENHAKDKNLYRGLRTCGSKVVIYGSQLFLYNDRMLHITPDAGEKEFGSIPDKIVANGAHFIPDKTDFNFALGPSLRYRRIFDREINIRGNKKTLVLLPHFTDEAEHILRMVIEAGMVSDSLMVKAHPTGSNEKIASLNLVRPNLVDGDIYDLFEKSDIVIGSASGTLLEAASVGVGVVSIRNNENPVDYNILPEEGRGLLWEEADGPLSLKEGVYKIRQSLEKQPGEAKKIVEDYRSEFFCRPTEERIAEAFDL